MVDAENTTNNTENVKKLTSVDQALNLIQPTMKFIDNNFISLFLKLMKIEILTLAGGFALLLLFSFIGLLICMAIGVPFTNINDLATFLANNIGISVLLISYVIISLVLTNWISKAISLTKIGIVKGQFDGNYPGIRSTFGKILIPVLKASLLEFLILGLALAGPLIILIPLIKFMPVAVLFAITPYILYLVAVIIAYKYFSQFWFWEIIIGGKGTREALKLSIDSSLNEIGGVVVYDVISKIAAYAMSFPFTYAIIIFDIFFRVGLFVTITAPGGLAAGIGIIIGYLLLLSILSILMGVLVETAVLPYTYSFWSWIKNPVQPELAGQREQNEKEKIINAEQSAQKAVDATVTEKKNSVRTNKKPTS